MENANKDWQIRHNQAKVLSGIFIIFFGVMFLLNRTGFHLPHWILSWKSIVIAVGIVSLYKHDFKNFFGYFLILFGGVFMINEFRPDTINSVFVMPVIVILIGIMTIAKATRFFGIQKNPNHPKTVAFDEKNETDNSDFLESTTVFGGVNKNVVSKNFKGGSITTYFGGTEINLSQADIQEPIIIDSTSTFGGLKLIVPSSWDVRSELTTVFGGLEDKRPIMSDKPRDPNKLLILKGSCFFGGVEIQSYI